MHHQDGAGTSVQALLERMGNLFATHHRKSKDKGPPERHSGRPENRKADSWVEAPARRQPGLASKRNT